VNRSQPSLRLPLPPVGVDSTLVATPVPSTTPHHQQWLETYRGRELKLVWYWLSIRTAGRHGKKNRGWEDARQNVWCGIATWCDAGRRDAINLPYPLNYKEVLQRCLYGMSASPFFDDVAIFTITQTILTLSAFNEFPYRRIP
jgi:hypothetical protein